MMTVWGVKLSIDLVNQLYEIDALANYRTQL